MPVPNKGLGLGDYSGVDGQRHVHQNCICAVPSLIKQLKKCTDQECKDNIYQKLKNCTPVEILEDIKNRYGPFTE